MSQDKYEYLIKEIHWENSPERINQAIEKLVNIDIKDVHVLVMPKFDKGCWENSARIIKMIGYPKIKEIVPRLLEWLQDINWPGAKIVIELLSSIEPKELVKPIEETLDRAKADDDEMWMGGIKMLILNNNSKELLRREYKTLLESIDLC